jgi:hypothetical protein
MFKVYEKKASLIRFILLNLNEKGWLCALKAINYYKKAFVLSSKTHHPELDMIMVDANRAFVLYCCT